jgi:hypothetical protein
MIFTAHNICLDSGELTKPDKVLMSDHPVARSTRNLLNLVFPGDKSHLRLVDLGCLEGGYTVEFARMGFQALGIEVRDENFDCCTYVKQRTRLPNLDFAKDTAWNVADYGEFDVSFCCGLLYHLDKPRSFLEILARQTKKLIVLQTHFSVLANDPTRFHLSPVTENEGLKGRWFQEPTVDRERARWASWENSTSFWIQREHLIGLLKDLGFETIFEQLDGYATADLGQKLETEYNDWLRSTFIGMRA